MKTSHIILPALALSVGLLAACEDYTERNFGSRDELYQPTQVILHDTITLTDAHYAAVAQNAANIEAAEKAGLTERLQQVAADKAFNCDITPEDYLVPVLQQLVGPAQYYIMDAGSIIPVKCNVREQVLVDDPAYVAATGTTFSAGKYVMAPVGQDQVIGTSGLNADGEHPAYGYLYLTGGEKCSAVSLLGTNAYAIDDALKACIYTFEAEGPFFTIHNSAGYYLYLDTQHASLQYTDDLQNDCDDQSDGLWTVTLQDDGTCDIVNVGMQKHLFFDTKYGSAGCYTEKGENHVGLRLFKEGKVSGLQDGEAEESDVTFGFDGTEWAAKADYLNQALTGQTSTDAETVYALTGWSLENKDLPSELTYVWKLDGTYGLRASSYKSQFYAADSWAISPALKLKKAKQPVLTFDEAQKYAGTPLSDYLKVYVSTDYNGRGSMESATWTEVTDRLEGTRPDGSSWDYMPIRLDLSEWAGQASVNVAFRYVAKDSFAATWEIKNVVCREAE